MHRSIPTLAIVTALCASSFGCGKKDAAAGDGGAGSTASDSLPSLVDGFEGEIDVTAKGEKAGEAPVPLSLFIKSGKVRVDIPEELAKSAGPMAANAKGYGIFDSAAKKVFVVLDSTKQVLVIDLNKAGEDFKNMGGGPHGPHGPGGSTAPEGTPPKVTKTGKYDTVAGYKCENWDVASDHKEATVCVAQQGFSWFSIPMTGIPTEKLWMGELLDGKHFPLRFIGYGPDGVKEENRVEVTKIDKKSLPDTQFQYPPNYQLIDLQQMLRGFMLPGGPGGMPPGMPGMPPGMPGLPPGVASAHHK